MSDHVLGIDLGTSNSVVGVVRDGKPEVVTDADKRTVQPSVVSFHPSGSLLVGHEGKRRRLVDSKNTIVSAKRIIGRPFSDPVVQEFVRNAAFEIKEGGNEQPMISSRDQDWSIPEISALVLHHMKMLAERHLRTSVGKAVITVPANFNDAQRAATKAAGEIAGFEVMRIINEPTAAALAYGYGKRLKRRVLVYDFGGGTFDVTVLQIHGDIYEVLATAGNTHLGGDDMDNRLVAFMVHLFLERHRYDLRHNEVAMHRLSSVAEQVKVQLTGQQKAQVQVKEIAYGADGEPLNLQFQITRAELEEQIDDLIGKTFEVCDEVFRLARLRPRDVDEVILVGGSTRVPLVRRRVEEYFGKTPMASINPDEVVAIGAAIQGAALMQDKGDAAEQRTPAVQALLLDVTPLSLGIATLGGFTNVIIPRNAQVPAEQSRTFATSADNQTRVSIRICQGESSRFEENTFLGELELSGLTPGPRGQTKLDVTFEIDTDGLLHVQAQDTDSGQAQDATIKLVGMLSGEEMDRAVERHQQQTLGSGDLPAA